MTAFEKGVDISRQYLSRTDPKQTTLTQMGAMARVCAKRHYRTEAKQQEFVKGWYAYSQQFQTLFKDYPTQLHIMGITFKCEHCKTTFEIEYEEPTDFSELRKAQHEACPICHDTGKAIEQ
jgi:transposase